MNEPENWCKIVETKHGKAVVFIEEGDEDRNNVVTIVRPKGLGTCKLKASITEESEESYAKAQRIFNNTDVESCEIAYQNILSYTRGGGAE